MEPDFSKYQLEGDPSAWANENGLVVPVVTRAGSEG
ncbi:cupin, partial [Salmonella enterica subsp. enterica serovar Senftenberg]|nr:cupin [Salmonella enterica subsp. enterica serovar Senftenberg]